MMHCAFLLLSTLFTCDTFVPNLHIVAFCMLSPVVCIIQSSMRFCWTPLPAEMQFFFPTLEKCATFATFGTFGRFPVNTFFTSVFYYDSQR